MVDHLQTKFPETSVSTTCIYCDYREKGNQAAYDLLASVFKQLVQDCESLSESVKALYNDHVKRNARLPPEELIQALHLEIIRYRRVFVVVDALDECTEEGNTRMDLLDTLRSLPGNINLLVTSRHISTIASEFIGATTLEVIASDSDVTRYILGRIQREHRLARHIKADPSLRQSLINKIVERARGMYVMLCIYVGTAALI